MALTGGSRRVYKIMLSRRNLRTTLKLTHHGQISEESSGNIKVFFRAAASPSLSLYLARKRMLPCRKSRPIKN